MTEENGKQYALITGASSGIGYELAKLFGEKGYNLILVSRDEDQLEKTADAFIELYNVNVIVIPKDLFQPMAAFEIYDEVMSMGITVNVLVNDAGQGVYGKFVETDIREQLQIIQLNIASLTTLTHLFLKDMVARDEGKILQLASVASDMPHPLLAVYAATKAYVLSLTESLVNELKDTSVTITALQPGATATDFFHKAGAENAKVVQDGKLSDPARVARDGFDALMAGKDKVVSGLKNKVMSAMSHVTPDQMLAEQVRKTQLEEKDLTK
jgi:uncharacterized protein